MMQRSVTFSPIQVTFPAHLRARLLEGALLQYNALDEVISRAFNLFLNTGIQSSHLTHDGIAPLRSIQGRNAPDPWG